MNVLYIVVQILVVIGLLCGVLMFWSTRSLPLQMKPRALRSLSIVIPARNEALRLPPLLTSLQTQTLEQVEVIVVDASFCYAACAIMDFWGAACSDCAISCVFNRL